MSGKFPSSLSSTCLTLNLETEESNFTDGGWIQWFCSIDDHGFFCEVDEDYIRGKNHPFGLYLTYLDSFHLYGLKKMFNRFNDALEMILDPECPDDEELEDEK